jgi:8-oxo-dGTP pyrophosphatase MutT (NUDIX family)
VTFAEAVSRLETGMKGGLPGSPAHAHLAPVPPRKWPAGFNEAKVRDAAGLLLVFPKRPEESADIAEQAPSQIIVRPAPLTQDAPAHVILTVRADGLRHAGQVSLPGGVVDPGETFEQAALREAQEEIALAVDNVRVLGALTPLDIPVSGFRLHPIVAAQTTRPRLKPSDTEVARILEVSVADLLNGEHFVTTRRTRDGFSLTVPAFQIGSAEIWGATAMVLAEFLTILGWGGPM